METLPVQKRQGLSGTTLKLMACITMLIDHIGASCLEAGLLVPLIASGTFSTDPAAASLLQMDRVLRYIGRLAFPIFCFLLVEGFLHTHDVKRYVERLFLFGLLSEVPFDMAFFRTPFHWGNQNVYWTLALGVLAMALMQKFQDAEGNIAWKGRLAALGCVVLAQLLQTDYGAIGVALIVALYLTRNNLKYQCIIGAAMMLFELTAPLAFVLIWFYNGQRGRCPQWVKWAFYGFYPVHLSILAVVTNWVL